MGGRRNATEPSYSQRLLAPFVQLLSRYPGFPSEALDRLRAMDPDDRVPIARAHLLLDAAVRFTGDENLGLKAGREMTVGDAGALDYAVSSAPDVRAAIECAARYLRLVNDGVTIRLEPDPHAEDRTILRFESLVTMPASAEQFMLSALYSQHAPGLRRAPGLAIWFMHARPADASEYERTFPGAELRFSAPCSACAFGRSYLDLPLATADSKLHAVIRKHAEQMLAELPRAQGLTERVRELLAAQLSQGQPSVAETARALQLSTRTLGRRLEAEGTSFSEVLDDVRRRLALQYLTNRRIALTEIAFLLGFAHVPAFHRAFKRWTGQTPLEYRRAGGREGA